MDDVVGYDKWLEMAEYFFNTNQEQWMYLCLMRSVGYLEIEYGQDYEQQ